MGYTTEFRGAFRITPELTGEICDQLNNISQVDHRLNSDMPGYFCQWIVTGSNVAGWVLEWDGIEKFYDYTEWLKWLLKNVFIPNGYELNGEIIWQGEEVGDIGILHIDRNVLTVQNKTHKFQPPAVTHPELVKDLVL